MPTIGALSTNEALHLLGTLPKVAIDRLIEASDTWEANTSLATIASDYVEGFSACCSIAKLFPRWDPSYDEALVADWRGANFMPTDAHCCICGSTELIGSEPRFLYDVCQTHSRFSPVLISALRSAKLC